MSDNKLVNQIGDLIDNKLEPIKKDLKGVKKQLDTVELKVELVNKRVEKVHQELKQSIEQSQEETIEVLSALIHTGYNMHEKRIKNIEEKLQTTNPQ